MSGRERLLGQQVALAAAAADLDAGLGCPT